MAKLVRCTVGRILDVRCRSAHEFARHSDNGSAIELSVPKTKLSCSFLSALLTALQRCPMCVKSNTSRPGSMSHPSEGGIAWNDPDVGNSMADSMTRSFPNEIQNQITLKQYRENPAFR